VRKKPLTLSPQEEQSVLIGLRLGDGNLKTEKGYRKSNLLVRVKAREDRVTQSGPRSHPEKKAAESRDLPNLCFEHRIKKKRTFGNAKKEYGKGEEKRAFLTQDDPDRACVRWSCERRGRSGLGKLKREER